MQSDIWHYGDYLDNTCIRYILCQNVVPLLSTIFPSVSGSSEVKRKPRKVPIPGIRLYWVSIAVVASVNTVPINPTLKIMAQFSLNNVHKRGLKHHHFISTLKIGLKHWTRIFHQWAVRSPFGHPNMAKVCMLMAPTYDAVQFPFDYMINSGHHADILLLPRPHTMITKTCYHLISVNWKSKEYMCSNWGFCVIYQRGL